MESSVRRVVAWTKDDPLGAEIAAVTLSADRLAAAGTAIGSDPEIYRLDYELTTGPRFVTTHLHVVVTAESWGRSLDLTRTATGEWHATTSQNGTCDLPTGGVDMHEFDGALDTDLGLSPLFNTMPVLRHRLMDRGNRADDFVMVWVSVPDLQLHASVQRYTQIEPADGSPAVIRFESVGDDTDFRADIVFDEDGLVLDYPEVARRMGAV
jgi:hypothetical protein